MPLAYNLGAGDLSQEADEPPATLISFTDAENHSVIRNRNHETQAKSHDMFGRSVSSREVPFLRSISSQEVPCYDYSEMWWEMDQCEPLGALNELRGSLFLEGTTI